MPFLNLSNHPSAGWTPSQLLAAQQLGGPVLDLPGGMPLVPADADTADVLLLAQQVAARAVQSGATAAGVATELVFTTALVAALQAHHVACYAATTARQAVESTGADGAIHKTSVFRFVRWRRYPDLRLA